MSLALAADQPSMCGAIAAAVSQQTTRWDIRRARRGDWFVFIVILLGRKQDASDSNAPRSDLADHPRRGEFRLPGRGQRHSWVMRSRPLAAGPQRAIYRDGSCAGCALNAPVNE